MRLGYLVSTRSGDSPQSLTEGPHPLFGAGGQMGLVNAANADAGDILVGRVGTVGSVRHVSQPVWATDNTIIVTPAPHVEPRWVAYLLQSSDLGSLASATATAQPLISASEVRATPCPAIDLEEQRRIADFLDDRVARIDQIIAARDAQVELLDRLLLERMRSAVAGVIDPNRGHRSDALRWVEAIHEAAIVLPLSRVVTLQRGVDLTDGERRPGLAKVVTTAGVVGTHDQAIEPGPGVVIGRYGSVGNVHWVDGPYWPHNTTLYVRNDQGNELRWLYYLLRTFPYGAMQARAAIPGVNRNDMATELVAWIPPERQRVSIRWLDRYEEVNTRRRSALRMSVKRLTEYRQSLITAAVTGQLDVTTAGRGVRG